MKHTQSDQQQYINPDDEEESTPNNGSNRSKVWQFKDVIGETKLRISHSNNGKYEPEIVSITSQSH